MFLSEFNKLISYFVIVLSELKVDMILCPAFTGYIYLTKTFLIIDVI